MRVLGAAAVLFVPFLFPARAETPLPPGVSPAEAHAGCLHNDLRPCMISLGSVFWFDMKRVLPQIASRNELDVNGQTAHRNIVMTVAVPNHLERAQIRLTLASPTPNDQVVRAELRLPSNPDAARTPSEYDKTWLYETVSTLLGDKNCPGLDRLTLYRFFENSVKPREKTKTEIIKYGILHRTKQSTDTEKIPFCHVLFSLHSRVEWDGSPNPDLPHRGKSDTVIVLE